MSPVGIGYTCMSEQSDPRWLVRDARAAEEAGFDTSSSPTTPRRG